MIKLKKKKGNAMNNEQKNLLNLIEEAKDDPCLQNLYFRYIQNLELGDSHWRETMHYEKPTHEYPSIKREEEAKILKQNPYADANQIYLMQKYMRQR